MPGELIPVVISGPSGIGKTALALRAAHQVSGTYDDGQLFAQLQEDDHTPASPEGLLEGFLRSFGVSPDDIPATVREKAALYRSWLAGRRVLVVLDNAARLSQVRPLLPGTPNCGVIITCRSRLAGLEGARYFELGVLDEASGIDLVTTIIGPERATAERHLLPALVAACDQLPLALRITAAKLAARPHLRIEQMLLRLKDARCRLDEFELDDMSIRASLSVSFENLTPEAGQLLALLGLLGSAPFAPSAGAALLDAEIETGNRLLEELIEARLVKVLISERDPIRYQLSDLVQLFAAERFTALSQPGQRAESAPIEV